MDQNRTSNPILPAPGVCRNPAITTEASRTAGSGRQNDDASTNRATRGETSENGGRGKALLRCRTPLLMGTFNANTLRTEYSAAECEQRRFDAGIEILGVQEHRIVLSDPNNIEYRTIGSGFFVISSAWRNQQQAAVGGVGLLLGRTAKKALLEVKRVSDRILRAEFDGNPRTTILVAYSPTNCAEENVMEEFYEKLRNTLQDVPAHNFLSILADFNARIGPEVAPHTFHDATNRNRGFLSETMTEYGLLAANAQF